MLPVVGLSRLTIIALQAPSGCTIYFDDANDDDDDDDDIAVDAHDVDDNDDEFLGQ